MTGVEFSETDCFQSDASTDAVEALATQLRIGGLFLILVFSAVGAYLPYWSRTERFRNAFILGQAFAGANPLPGIVSSVLRNLESRHGPLQVTIFVGMRSPPRSGCI